MVEVHGKVIAGGVMLVWPFDIVIASEDATFQDNTVAMGICGAEFFNASGGGGDRNRAARCSVEDPVTPDVGCSELAP